MLDNVFNIKNLYLNFFNYLSSYLVILFKMFCYVILRKKDYFYLHNIDNVKILINLELSF